MAASFYFCHSLCINFFINPSNNKLAVNPSRVFAKISNFSTFTSYTLFYGLILCLTLNPIAKKYINKNF